MLWPSIRSAGTYSVFNKKIPRILGLVRQYHLEMVVGKRAGEVLRGPDAPDIYLRLLDYARALARRKGWRTDKTLPQGESPESITNEVLRKVLEGQRTWDENKEPSLLNALKGMVKSELGHLFERFETKHVESTEQITPDGSERTADSFESSDRNPLEEVLQIERTQLEITALDLIRERVEGNEELECVFLALHYSDGREEIARETGLPVERVDYLRTKLERIAQTIKPASVARFAKERRRKYERR